MFGGLFLLSLIVSCVQGIKEAYEPVIPAENWANKELYHKDLMNGVSVEQRMKNLKNAKYKLIQSYPEPHRDSVSGKIVIENCKLYNEDVKNYGAYQAHQWVKQGKYNLSPEKLEEEHKRIRKEMEHLYGLL